MHGASWDCWHAAKVWLQNVCKECKITATGDEQQNGPGMACTAAPPQQQYRQQQRQRARAAQKRFCCRRCERCSARSIFFIVAASTAGCPPSSGNTAGLNTLVQKYQRP